MFDLFRGRKLNDPSEMREIDFTTANPAISSKFHWLHVLAQTRALEPSTVKLTYDPEAASIRGTTTNVSRLSIDLDLLPPATQWTVELDGERFEVSCSADGEEKAWFERVGEEWVQAKAAAPEEKSPERGGPFKEAFRNHVVLVYGTHGTAEENAWAEQKANLDAESFLYRGNGSLRVYNDEEFDPQQHPDSNVVVYGNEDTVSCWHELLAPIDVQLNSEELTLGSHRWESPSLACLFVYPRLGSSRALVGVVGGTGIVGMRAANSMPYFVSGVAYPDVTVVDGTRLHEGLKAIVGAGFFSNRWRVADGEFAFETETINPHESER